MSRSSSMVPFQIDALRRMGDDIRPVAFAYPVAEDDSDDTFPSAAGMLKRGQARIVDCGSGRRLRVAMARFLFADHERHEVIVLPMPDGVIVSPADAKTVAEAILGPTVCSVTEDSDVKPTWLRFFVETPLDSTRVRVVQWRA